MARFCCVDSYNYKQENDVNEASAFFVTKSVLCSVGWNEYTSFHGRQIVLPSNSRK